MPNEESQSPPVYCVVRDGVVSFVSSTSRDVSGLPPGQFEGQLALDLVHPEDRDQLRRFSSPDWQGAVVATFRVRDGDGSWSWRRAEGVRTFSVEGHASTVIELVRIDPPSDGVQGRD